MTDKLTGKQRAFVNAYLSNGMNGVQAAKAAGYKGTYNTLCAVAHENLRKPLIRKAIDQKLKAHKLSADEVLAKLSEQAAASIDEFLDKDGNFDIKKARQRKKLHLIKKLTVTRRTTKVAGRDVTIEKVTFELHNSQAALELLGRHHKVFTDQIDITSGGEPLQLQWPKALDDEESN